jgi:Mycotoxin biosynthesis protein UstYa
MIYSVALFHQMHCLGQLRRFSYLFLDAIVKQDAAQLKEIKHMFGELDHAEHMNHCFDYLRQTIACAGDMAMEWPRTEPDGRRFAVDGWGIPHECKSWVSILAWFRWPELMGISRTSRSTWTRTTSSTRGTRTSRRWWARPGRLTLTGMRSRAWNRGVAGDCIDTAFQKDSSRPFTKSMKGTESTRTRSPPCAGIP